MRLHTCRGGGITVESKIRGHVVELDTIGGWWGGGAKTTTTTAMEDDERHDDDNHDEGGGASPSTTSSYSTTTGTGGGTIHVKRAIEAKTLTIRSSSRVRARMLNVGSRLSVVASSSSSSRAKLDDDDGGAAIDIGSVYVVSSGSNGGGGSGDGEARLVVNGVHRPVSDGGGRDDGDDGDDGDGEGHRNPGLVRVKSSHGHIVVRAKTYRTSAFAPPSSSSSSSSAAVASETGGTSVLPSSMPLVDLGGVNGSCDVLLEGWSACTPSEMTTTTTTTTARTAIVVVGRPRSQQR